MRKKRETLGFKNKKELFDYLSITFQVGIDNMVSAQMKSLEDDIDKMIDDIENQTKSQSTNESLGVIKGLKAAKSLITNYK